MTATPHTPAGPVPADTGVVLDVDEAADLAALLDLIEDWLRHADDDARADLAGSAAGLTAVVEQNAVSLHRRFRKATTR